MKKLNLKWKISLVMVCVLFIVLVVLSYQIYLSSSAIVKEEVNKNVNIIQYLYNDKINRLMLSIDKQVNNIMQDDAINSPFEVIVEMSSMYNNAEEEKEFLSDFFSQPGMVYNASGKLNLLINREFNDAEFIYITTTNGVTIFDSRISVDSNESLEKHSLNILSKEKYKNAKFNKIYYDKHNPILLYSSSIYNMNDELMGYATIGFSPNIINIANEIPKYNNSNYALINNKGIIVNSSDDQFSKKIQNQWFIDQINKSNNNKSIIDNEYLIYQNINDSLHLATSIPTLSIFSPIYNLAKSIFYISLIALLISFIISYFFINRQLKPLSKFAKVFDKLKEGNLQENNLLDNKYENRNDEIGSLAQSFNSMVSQLRKLVNNIQNASTTLIESTQNIQQSISKINGNANLIGNATQNLAAGAEEQTAQIDETRNSVNDLNSKIEKIKSDSYDMNNRSNDVIENIKEGNITVNDSIEKIKDVKNDYIDISKTINALGDKSSEIDNITNLIGEISEQTNLLALNAAIEAARAGEAGRGFSVVADEIRKLANDSSNAADKISSLINQIQSNVNNVASQMKNGEVSVKNSVSSIEKTGNVFNKIEAVVLDLNKSIKNITDHNEQINHNSNEVENSINSISLVSDEFSRNSEDIASSSSDQLTLTQNLVNSIDKLTNLSEDLLNFINKFTI